MIADENVIVAKGDVAQVVDHIGVVGKKTHDFKMPVQKTILATILPRLEPRRKLK